MSSEPWSSRPPKNTPVDGDEILIIDSDSVPISEKNKRITLGSIPGVEANTASNVGTGEGIFKQKVGVDLEFKSLIGQTDKITLTGNVDDITFTLGSDVVTIDKANTFGDFKQTFPDNRLHIQNPAGTFTYQITADAIISDVLLNMPLLAVDDTIVTENFAQILTNKNLTSPIIGNFTNATHDHSNVSGGGTLLSTTALSDSANLARNTDTLAFFSATTSAELAGVISDETGTGLLVFGTSPTIITPTIASFTNAVHNHENTSGGGTLLSTSALSDTANIAYLNTPNIYIAGNKQSFVADVTAAGINLNAFIPSSPAVGDIFRSAEIMHFIGTSATDYILVSNGQPTTYTLGNRQDFLGDITGTAGINVGGIVGNPSAQVDGDIWLNTSSNQLFGRINGADVDLGVTGGTTSFIGFTADADLDMDSFAITFNGEGTAPSNTLMWIGREFGVFWFNTLDGNQFDFAVNGTSEMTIEAGEYNFQNNQVKNSANYQFSGNNTLPSDTFTKFIQFQNSSTTLFINVNSSDTLNLTFGKTGEYTFTNTQADWNNNTLVNASAIGLDSAGVTLGNGIANIFSNANGMVLNVPTGDDFAFTINGATAELTVALGVTTVNGDLVMGDRFQGSQGADVASASNITLGDGNFFDVTGATDILTITSTGWQIGSVVTLRLVGGADPQDGTLQQDEIALQTIYNADTNNTITLVFDGTVWQEIGRGD